MAKKLSPIDSNVHIHLSIKEQFQHFCVYLQNDNSAKIRKNTETAFLNNYYRMK